MDNYSKLVLSIVFFLLTTIQIQAQTTPLFQVDGTDGGVVIPRLNTAQRTGISAPSISELVYDTNTKSFWYYDGTSWQEIGQSSGGAASGILDSDGDTGVILSEGITDSIKFQIDGATKIVFESDSIGRTRIDFVNNEGNIAIGKQSQFSIANGQEFEPYSNISLGEKTLFSNTSGERNIAIGEHSLINNINGGSNIALGAFTLNDNISGFSNVAIGGESLSDNTTGSHNVGIGSGAVSSNTTGNDNIGLGSAALSNNTEGNENISIGLLSQRLNSTGSDNIALGSWSLFWNQSGSDNIAIGDSSLFNNTASKNIGIVARVMYENTAGTRNIGIGEESIYSNTTGNDNISLGYQSLQDNTNGNDNIALGDRALRYNTIGLANISIGNAASIKNTTGSFNIAIGGEALFDNVNTSNNVAIGFGSLDNTTSQGNTALGSSSGDTNLTGEYNVAIGAYADFSNPFLDDAVAIGSGTTVNASNKIRVGDSSITVIEGQVNFSSPSDRRFKYDVEETIPGLQFINALRPVQYKFDYKKFDDHVNQNITREKSQDYSAAPTLQSGFIAQEVESAAQAIGYNFHGLITPQNPTDNYGLRYADFVVPITKAIQELSATNEELAAENKDLKKMLIELKHEVDILKAKVK